MSETNDSPADEPGYSGAKGGFEDGGFAVSLEAAHSRARVARVGGDQAGREIMRAVGMDPSAAG